MRDEKNLELIEKLSLNFQNQFKFDYNASLMMILPGGCQYLHRRARGCGNLFSYLKRPIQLLLLMLLDDYANLWNLNQNSANEPLPASQTASRGKK